MTDSEKSISIDDYTFTLIRQTNHTEKYNHVVEISVIRNIDQTPFPNFWVYQSNSELGFWRLCYINIINRLGIETTPFHKGNNDYIQSTLIHLNLQIFINKQIDNIPFVELNVGEKEEQHFCLYGWTPEPMDRVEDELPYVEDVIDNKNRLINEEPFESLNNEEKCGFTENKSYSYIKGLLEVFSAMFRDAFAITKYGLLYNHNFNFVGMTNTIGDVYFIELTRKEPSEILKSNNVVLYFMVTQLIMTELVTPRFKDTIVQICGKKYHIFPFLLIPKGSSINYLGIYNQFIPCGIYICKLFDYSYQCSIEEEENGKCSESYSYIGNRYDNLFPINETLNIEYCSHKGGNNKSIKRKRNRTKKSIKRKRNRTKKSIKRK